MAVSLFRKDYNVIILSEVRITFRNCIEYIKKQFDNGLFRKGSKILILYGIHGNSDGTIGEKDESLKISFEAIPKQIKKKFPHILENIDIEMVDVGDKMNDDKLDEKALIKAIKEKEHSILFLAFCWTDRSALNDILRAAGIYAHLIMTEDRKEITNGRYFTLDDIQKEVIDEVVKNPVQNVFLWGSSGTGKTLLLAMILSMKISHYFKKGIKVNIIVYFLC